MLLVCAHPLVKLPFILKAIRVSDLIVLVTEYLLSVLVVACSLSFVDVAALDRVDLALQLLVEHSLTVKLLLLL